MDKKVKRKKRELNFNEMPEKTFIKDNGWVSQWCCTCKTRHILHLQIHKGNKEIGKFIEINWFQDNMATALRKFYEKHNKKTLKQFPPHAKTK